MATSLIFQILTSGLTGGIAGGVVNQGMTWWRESRTASKKSQYELSFIAVDLVFRLEKLAEQCAEIVKDQGCPDLYSRSGIFTPTTPYPVFSISEVKGDWRFLDTKMMYQIHSLPVRIDEARRQVEATNGQHVQNPKQPHFYDTRQKEFADIGLRAMYINRRLRTLCNMPASSLAGTECSAWQILRKKVAETRLERYRAWHKLKYAIPLDNNVKLKIQK
ncbi:hypothetical protein ACP3TG_29020 [Phytobacter diazotrophicus]